MSDDLIRVQPLPELRRPFARWAVAQRPKVRTVSVHTFGVPAQLFADMPEDLLIGARVDGHPYISPLDGTGAVEAAGAGAPELTGVDTPPVHRPGPASGRPRSDGGLVAVDYATVEDTPADAVSSTATPAPPEDTLGDSPGDTTEGTPAVTSGDTQADTRGDSDSSDSSRPYTCEQCARSFTTGRGLDMHRSRAHREE